MKKKLYSPTILLFAVFTMFLSCKKETQLMPDAQQVKDPISTRSGRLVFSDTKVFETLVSDKPEKIKTVWSDHNISADFRSMLLEWGSASSGRKKNEPMPVENETLASMLNADGVVQIGKWIIKVNPKDSLVTLIDEKHLSNQYKNLLSDTKSSEIYRFSTNDDVLPLLEAGYTGTPDTKSGRTTGIFCCCGISGGANSTDWEPWPSTSNGVSVTVRAVNVYEKYGVYFEASTRIESSGALLFSPDPRSGKYFTKWAWKQKCRNGDSKSDTFDGLRDFSMSWDPSFTAGWVFKNKIYGGTTGLQSLTLTATYGLAQSGFQDFFPGNINR